MDETTARLRRTVLEAIHDGAVDAIITITEQGIIETVNPATQSMLGYSPAELIGQNVRMLMPAPFRDGHDGYLANYRSGGVRKVIGIGREVVARRKDGTTLPVHLAVSEVRVENRRIFTGFLRDLTDVKAMEIREAALGRIIEDSLNEVYIFDRESLMFLDVNRGARVNIGYSLDQLCRMTPVDIKPDFTASQFRELIRPLLSGNVEKLEFVTWHQRSDGSIYDVEVHMQKSTRHGQSVLVSIILDITAKLGAERKMKQVQKSMHAELGRLVKIRTQELRQVQEKLAFSEKFSTLGRIAGSITHEIRNPLNVVMTSAYYLINATSPAPEKVKEHLERIGRHVTLIDNVITTLSEVARMPEATLSPTAMGPLLQRIIGSIGLPKSIKTSLELPDGLPDVLVDENQISIAFGNLIRNARDAMPAGGTITIRAAFENDNVTFTVIDTGVGIPPDVMRRIWEPLFTTKAHGMGLGLSITRSIVEKNRGELSAASIPGQGSQFKIALKPRVQDPALSS